MASTKGAGQMHGMHADGVGKLAQSDGIGDARAQQLFGRAEPCRRAADVRLGRGFAAGPGDELERKALCRERRGCVGGAKLSGEPPGEPTEPGPSQIDEPVET